jgi:hypothetical protein
MNPSRSRFLSSPGKLIIALPAVLGATQAGAAIVYTPVDASAGTITFELDGRYRTNHNDYHFTLQAKSGISVSPANFDGASGYLALSGATSFFDAGQNIGPASGLTFSDEVRLVSVPPDTSGYLGFRYDFNGTTTYGWAEAKVTDGGGQIALLGIAYEDSGASIVTGDTGSPPIPEPGNTAAFAGLVAGAAAALVARRNRKAKAAAIVA